MAGPSSDSNRQPSILIVDDEMVIRDLCAQALAGYRVLHAGNGQEALDILAHETVAEILTDVMMPVMNGLDLLARVKAQVPNQVVVVMTGFGDKDIILRALKTGADDFIQKPINLLQLKTSITQSLEKKALREELVQLKRMDRLKSDFLGLISHKLKTPITVISLFLQSLARDPACIQEPASQNNLKLILEESGYLSSLINDLLNFSNIILRDTQGEREQQNPVLLVNEALLELRELAERRQIRLDCRFADALPDFLGDRQQIEFSLRAVIENALKFSPTGSRVKIELGSDNRQVTLRVTDQGPGIPADEQTKIFERFYQIDPDRTGQVRGFGLGLFYARQFVRDHGGTIDLHSHPGQGSVFTLCFPV
jgi:signal transduction histidine kinase